MTREAQAKACLQYFTSINLEGLRKSMKISRQSSPSPDSNESSQVKNVTASANLHDLVISHSVRSYDRKLLIKEQRSVEQLISFAFVHTAGTANSECRLRLQINCITKQYFLMYEWNRKFKHIYNTTKIKTSCLWKAKGLTAFLQT